MVESQGPIGKVSKEKQINIIGAGVSGLFLGYYLKKRNIPFKIFEKESSIGGKIGTQKTENGLFEKAANAVYANDDVYELLNELEVKYLVAPKKLKKVVWRNNKPTSPPISFLEILSSITKLGRTPDINSNSSLLDFFGPLLGKKLANELVAPVFAGVYAEDISNLHFKSIFKDYQEGDSYFQFLKKVKSKRKKQTHKVQSLGFDGGMQTLINRLYDELKEDIELNSTMDDLNLENAIICTNAIEAADLLKNRFPKISEILNSFDYNSLATATIIVEDKISFLDKAFGILFSPKQERFTALGILANSEIFTGRVSNKSHSSYTFILKDSNSTEEIIKDDLSKIGFSHLADKIVEIKITPWKHALPVYNKKRYENTLKLKAEFLNLNDQLSLFGNYVDGISIREMLSHAKIFASKL